MSQIAGALDGKVAAISQVTGLQSHEMSMVFAGPPRYEQLESGFDIHLIGLAAEVTVGDARQTQRGQVISSKESIVMGITKGDPNGAIRGLGLLMEDAEGQVIVTGSTYRASLLKLMYSSMLKADSTKDLIKYFYKGSGEGDDLGLTPVAHADGDAWINFAKSQLFDLPIGIYKVSRSSVGNVLEATYYEGVMLEGSHRSDITVRQGTPVFKQLQFSCSRMVPLDPGDVASDTETDVANASEYISLMKKWLGS